MSPLMPAGWDTWRFWQYSEQGLVDGVEGFVDLNIYNGSLEDFQAFVSGG